MVKALLLVAVIAGVLAMAISCMNPFRRSEHYSVRLENLGTKKIIISEFQLFESRGFNTAGAHVWPGTFKQSAPYFEDPNEELSIEWKIADMEDVLRDNVRVTLPPGFRNGASTIVFCFDSDKKKLKVAYELTARETGETSVVGSDGSPVDVRRAVEH